MSSEKKIPQKRISKTQITPQSKLQATNANYDMIIRLITSKRKKQSWISLRLRASDSTLHFDTTMRTGRKQIL